MPIGVSHPEFGLVAFTAVKFAGYTLAAKALNPIYDRPDRNIWVVGATRTLIGLGFGTIYRQLVPAASAFDFMAGLFPIRLLEWALLVWLFYDRKLELLKIDWKVVFVASFWSYALDVPAVLGYISVSGFWIC
jgi:hypothetical protein